eukprot:scaffold685_cov281-Pinguiococcus_pyrenoidosus.AAC.1
MPSSLGRPVQGAALEGSGTCACLRGPRVETRLTFVDPPTPRCARLRAPPLQESCQKIGDPDSPGTKGFCSRGQARIRKTGFCAARYRSDSTPPPRTAESLPSECGSPLDCPCRASTAPRGRRPRSSPAAHPILRPGRTRRSGFLSGEGSPGFRSFAAPGERLSAHRSRARRGREEGRRGRARPR